MTPPRSVPEHEFAVTVQDMAATARLLWDKGWAEGSAGNISVLVSDANRTEHERIHEWSTADGVPLDRVHPVLAEASILVTGSGARMRDVAREPLVHTAVVRLTSGGNAYAVERPAAFPPLAFVPTSELPTHLAVHARLAGDGRHDRAVVHTHAPALLALSHHPASYDGAAMTDLLRRMLPEVALFLPR